MLGNRGDKRRHHDCCCVAVLLPCIHRRFPLQTVGSILINLFIILLKADIGLKNFNGYLYWQ